METTFDVLVLGLGAHGSSAMYHLAQTGYKVCGIDRFAPPHTHGSSHGQSRIIRQAYHESPLYVPFIKKAYELWNELETASGKHLFLQTGGLILGSEKSAAVTGAKLSAETHNVPYEYLESGELQRRFPALKPTEETVAVVEKNAGILFPEDCIKANLSLAVRYGALLLLGEPVTTIIPGKNEVRVVTGRSTYKTRKLIVSAGAWLSDWLPELRLPLNVRRQVLFWFTNTDAQQQPYLLPDRLPVYIWEYTAGRMFYGFPDLGDGIKIALHHEGQPVHPDKLSQLVSEAEISSMKGITDQYLALTARFHHSAVCMYTNTPDEHFIIDYHPQHKNIIIASPCSGHGFKFSSVIGKILCDMAMEKDIGFDLKPFRVSRFL